jgi:hypothetical protein
MAHWIGLATGITLIGGLFVLFKEELKDEWYKLTHKPVYVDVNTDEHATVQLPETPVIELPLNDINDDAEVDVEKLSDHKCNHENSASIFIPAKKEANDDDSLKVYPHSPDSKMTISSSSEESKDDESKDDESKDDESKDDESKDDESKDDESKDDESKDDITPESDSENDSPHFDEEDSNDEYSDTESE